jgi:hypothetical protein
VENELGYAADCKDVILQIKKFGCDGVLSLRQLQEVGTRTGLHLDGIHTDETVPHIFYTSAKSGLVYHERMLVVAAIVLARGTPVKKAFHLFEEYDIECNDSLDNIVVPNIFDDLVAITKAGLSAAILKNPSNSALRTYAHVLASNTEIAKRRFIKQLLGSTNSEQRDVSKEDFVSAVAGCEELLTSHGFRTYLHGAKAT